MLISAAHKSSGKTVISVGIMAALSERGDTVQAFKKGPDYIDPLWHRSATARPSYNLDFNTQSHQEIKELYFATSAGAKLSIVEGNKGLHDGLALDGSNSNAALAKLLDLPVVVVIDTRGMTRGVAPLLLGLQAFDKQVQIAGVIFNQVGGSRHESKLVQVTQSYTDIEVLGAIHRNPKLSIDERHLGLIPSNEAENAQNYVHAARQAAKDSLQLERISELAKAPKQALSTPSPTDTGAGRLRIAIAQDAAFGFYYADDLERFRQCGVRLIPFDTLSDTRLPDCDGLLIGGGFPETQMQALSANHSLRAAIKTQLEHGLPCYAECGGLMYLSESIEWQQQRADMVGFIPAQSVMHARPQGRGYVHLEATSKHPWHHSNDGLIHAHEFHHSQLSDSAELVAGCAYRVRRGKGIGENADGIVRGNTLASYAHLRSTAQFDWVKHFTDFVRSHKRPRP